MLQSVDAGLLPPELTDALTTGNIELRQQVRYDSVSKYLEFLTFPVMVGSPALTSTDALPCDPLEQFRVKVTTASASGSTVSFAGIVAGGGKTWITNATEGDAFTLTASFRTAGGTNSAVYCKISLSTQSASQVAGVGSMSMASAVPQPPVVVVTSDFTTVQPETQLDASGSADPNGAAQLSYYWRPVQGAAVIRGCRTATPTIQFAGGPGQYKFAVSVISAAGVSTDSSVTVTYYGH